MLARIQMILMVAFLIISGFVEMIAPRALWKREYSYLGEDREPTKEILKQKRGVGLFCILLGIFTLFYCRLI